MKPLKLRSSRARPAGDDEAKRLFGFHLRAAGVSLVAGGPIEEEFVFEAGRRSRWDFALPSIALAIEINGGIWTRGAHGHPTDILRNMDKCNRAAALGWRVLAFSPEQVKSGEALSFTLGVIERLHYLRRSTSTSLPPNLKPPATRHPGLLLPDEQSIYFSTQLPRLDAPKGSKRRAPGRSSRKPPHSSAGSS